jgi:hypothetical protein
MKQLRTSVLAALALALSSPVAAQFDAQHDHLECFKIKGGAIVTAVQTDNQFGRQMIFKLVPRFLCAPTEKTCVATDGSCDKPGGPAGDPVPHFECYKVSAKECPNGDCTKLSGRFTPVPAALQDQFGTAQVSVGVPKMLCAPVNKTLTVTTTSTTRPLNNCTTTTIQLCGNGSPPQTCSPPPAGCPGGQTCQTDSTGCSCVGPAPTCDNAGVFFCSTGTCPAGQTCQTVCGADGNLSCQCL